ncbi:MAG TPA: VOC family protein [Candidatus Nitrosocosmicus sp.]|jgi:catechol 2,3-dioxygenase-like lactoylglutathione lyase family enzyme|nr:VOC family protein [Candidatus Nitrosocosmicus sp.]
MIGDKEAAATIAVKDLAVAKDFYETKLGLKRVATEGDEALVYRSGVSKVVVYRSEYAGTNRATTANWMVGKDLEREVEALKGRGVRFEHYDMPGLTRQGDVHVAGDMKVAWFKDPDGNILSLISG